jgi:hypothetical protein
MAEFPSLLELAAQEDPLVFFQSYWESPECEQKLDSAFVCRSLMLRWANLAATPAVPEWSTFMQRSRKLYMSLLQRGSPSTFHNSWSKVCALFDLVFQKLVEAESYLVDDLPLLITAVVGISRKDEFSASSGCWNDLSNIATMFELGIGVPAKTRDWKDFAKAEFEVMRAINFDVPQTDTYTCISAMLLRADILTMGLYKQELEEVWQTAVQKAMDRVLFGVVANGYETARGILFAALMECKFPLKVVDKLLDEAAPLAENDI